MKCLVTDNKHPQIVKLQTELNEQAIGYLAGEDLESLMGFFHFIAAKKFAWTCSLRDNCVAPLYVRVVEQMDQFIVALFDNRFCPR